MIQSEKRAIIAFTRDELDMVILGLARYVENGAEQDDVSSDKLDALRVRLKQHSNKGLENRFGQSLRMRLSCRC